MVAEIGSRRLDRILDVSVDCLGRLAGHDERSDLVEDPRRERPRPVHSGEIGRVVDADAVPGQTATSVLVHALSSFCASP